MSLDNRTLLLCLVIVCGAMAMSMAFVSRSGEHDGLRKWAVAMGLESVAWFLISVRGMIPDAVSIIAANLLLATALSTKLAAIYDYRGLAWPRWKCLLPILLIFLTFIPLQYGDFRGRLIYGSLIYGTQMLMIAHALRADVESRAGRAWWLLFGSTAAILPILALRAIVAFLDTYQFGLPQTSTAPNPVQLAAFVCVIVLGIAGSMGFILMIKERAERESRALAMIDSLTGVFNRRAFMERAEKEWAAAQRSRLPLGLLMIDVDYFKDINDKYGHPAGDAALAEVARILASRLRKQDTIGRYGGEEFCVLLPATDENGAATLGETLRTAIENTPLAIAGQNISATISIGASSRVSSAKLPSSFGKLLDAADTALYRAKREGRNRTILLAESLLIAPAA